MTITKYTAALLATSLAATTAFAQDAVPGAQKQNFGTTPGYIGTQINATQNQYKSGELINYTVDVFAQTAAGAPVAVRGFDIAVNISPLNTLANTADDILFRTFPKAYTPDGVLTEVPEIENTKPLPSLSPGKYAIYTSGSIGETPLTKGAYDVFTIVADSPAVATAEPASSLDIYLLYEGIPFVTYAGRYGANKPQPKKSNGFPYEGIVRADDGELKTSSMNLSHNFEFKVNKTEPTQIISALKKIGIDASVNHDDFGTTYVASNGTVYREALIAYDFAQGKQDVWDIGEYDIDLHAHLNGKTVLAFDQSYEVKQDAVRDGVGRSSNLNNVPLQNQYTVGEGALALSVDRPDEGWLVKALYKDDNNNGTFEINVEPVLSIDALALGVNNKSANASLVGVTAYSAGVLTGLGLDFIFLHPPVPVGPAPQPGTIGFGPGGSVVRP